MSNVMSSVMFNVMSNVMSIVMSKLELPTFRSNLLPASVRTLMKMKLPSKRL